MGVPSSSQLCGHLARLQYLSFMSVGWASWKVAGLESSCWHLLFCPSPAFPCKNSCPLDKGSQKQEHVFSLSLSQRPEGEWEVEGEP